MKKSVKLDTVPARVALVTGVASGFDEATVRLLGADAVRLLLVDINAMPW